MTLIKRNQEAIERAERARLDALKEAGVERLYQALDEISESLTGPYPRVERDSWPQKEEEARSVLNGGPGPMIAQEATLRGETPEQLAQLILGRSLAFRQMVAYLSGMRMILETGIRDCSSGEEIDGVLEAGLASIRQTLLSMAGGAGGEV